jgi:hypothetical protein
MSLLPVRPYLIFPNFSFRIFILLIPTCLCNYVSDRILPAATVRMIEWMGYLRSVIRPTHWVTSILNIGKKMKNLPLFCLYRLLKNSAIFIVLMHSSDNFIGLVNMTLPSDVHFLSDEIQYNQLIHQCRRYKSNLFDAVKW